jgi:hypothetical protein
MTPIRVLGGVDDDLHPYDKKLDNQLKLLAEESFPNEEKDLIRSYARMLQARGLNKDRIARPCSS